MKKQEAVPENTIVIDIRLTRGLVLTLGCVLAAVALFAYLALSGGSALASDAQAVQAGSTGMRQYYLTETLNNGVQARTACGRGYHFASLWELTDPSNLKYNTDLGFQWGDAGQGPPTERKGWVRTGSSGGSGASPGAANCEVWTTTTGNGSMVKLDKYWDVATPEIGVWTVLVDSCSDTWYVWCIED